MLENVFLISLSMSVVILLLLLISPFINKRYSAKWKYFVWLILALRLVIPLRLEMPQAPVSIPVTDRTVVLRTDGIPFQIMNDSYIEKSNNSPNSADYAPIITMDKLLLILWGTGAFAFFMYHILCYIVFKRRITIKKCEIVLFENLLDNMKIKSKVSLYVCDEIKSPMMIGFVKPMILLPNADYTDDELAVILKHELTHVKRLDIWYKLLLILANSIHWFNPVVYIMVKQANRDLEYSCDDLVVLGEDMEYKKNYSLTILKSMKESEQNKLSTYLNGGIKND